METYLSVEGVARYLGIAEKTVRKWVLNDDIPFRKIHKMVRFRVSEIERWIDGGGVLPLLGDEAGAMIAGAVEAGAVESGAVGAGGAE